MTSAPRYWRMQKRMRGPEWGRGVEVRADEGEWELPIESRYNGRGVMIGYLRMTDVTTGRARVSQVRVEGVTVPLIGTLEDVASRSIRVLTFKEKAEGRSGAMAEVAVFLTMLHHEQIRQENARVMNGGRGKLDLQEARKDPEVVVVETIKGLVGEGVIGEEEAGEMLTAVNGLREEEGVGEAREMEMA